MSPPQSLDPTLTIHEPVAIEPPAPGKTTSELKAVIAAKLAAIAVAAGWIPVESEMNAGILIACVFTLAGLYANQRYGLKKAHVEAVASVYQAIQQQRGAGEK